VFSLLAFDNHDTNNRSNQTEGARDQGKYDPFQTEIRIEPDAEDHRADILGGRGFKPIGATASTITDVVATQIRDHRGVSRVVFGYAGFDLADKISANIRGLGIDTPAKLGE